MKTAAADQDQNLHKSCSNLVRKRKHFKTRKEREGERTVNREKQQDILTNLNHVKIKQIPGKMEI